MIHLQSCPKAYATDADKAVTPAQTVARVTELFATTEKGVLGELRRIDNGRLGIPVYASMAGEAARRVMPTRKQMGKGASPEQAQASALMELVERYSFFSFWKNPRNFVLAGYSEAEARFGEKLMGLDSITRAVGEDLSPARARQVMDLVQWRFCAATEIGACQERIAPIGWFKMLGEFNGSSAGNTPEESILQGACELVERHVCDVIDRDSPTLPSIDPESFEDPVLCDLYEKFVKNGVEVILKDFTLDTGVPTVGALAWDPATFPGMSEIVYTAGTAASPAKAAVRALTEVAQLAGDFSSGAVYEASGLGKFTAPEEFAWLREGPVVALSALPSIEADDIRQELAAFCAAIGRQGHELYAIDIAHPRLKVPAHYNFVPGFGFRERDRHASLGMFVGRFLAEEEPPSSARAGLKALAAVYGEAFFLPFYEALLSLRTAKGPGDAKAAAQGFLRSEALQPDDEHRALAAFYAGYALTQGGEFAGAEPHLDRAIAADALTREFFNLRGVCRFKAGRYQEAAQDFSEALNLDRGSAMDLANLGLCHKFLGETDKAADYLSTALKLDPSITFAQEHLDELRGSAGGGA